MTIRLNPANLAQTRSDLGLGNAATKTVGTANGNVIAADATGLPAINASQVTNLNASNIASGTVPVARLGSGATATKFLRGDGTFQEAGGATELISSVTVTSAAPVDYVTFAPITGWFDGTYRELHLYANSIRPNTSNVYLRLELAYNHSSSGTSFYTENGRYRTQGQSIRNASESIWGTGDNYIGHISNHQDVQSDYLGILRMDFSWFIDSTVGNLNKNQGRKNPMIHYTYTHGESTSDANATMHMGQITCIDGTGDHNLNNSTGWVGFRLKYNSGQINNGQFYLTGIKA